MTEMYWPPGVDTILYRKGGASEDPLDPAEKTGQGSLLFDASSEKECPFGICFVLNTNRHVAIQHGVMLLEFKCYIDTLL
jgi:hypothetical protein